jgi:predicted permease
MNTATLADRPGVQQARSRALCVAAGAAAAAITWALEVPLLGLHLATRFGAMRPQTVTLGHVLGAALAAGLLGWLLLALLERRTPRARRAWTSTALFVLAASLAGPLAAATTASAATGLIALNLVVGAVLIAGMARTAQAR